MDDGLVLVNLDVDVEETWCLNPYCSGQWSRTFIKAVLRTVITVLILVVVDNGLVLNNVADYKFTKLVLILVVVDNGLVLDIIRLY